MRVLCVCVMRVLIVVWKWSMGLVRLLGVCYACAKRVLIGRAAFRARLMRSLCVCYVCANFLLGPSSLSVFRAGSSVTRAFARRLCALSRVGYARVLCACIKVGIPLMF